MKLRTIFVAILLSMLSTPSPIEATKIKPNIKVAAIGALLGGTIGGVAGVLAAGPVGAVVSATIGARLASGAIVIDSAQNPVGTEKVKPNNKATAIGGILGVIGGVIIFGPAGAIVVQH